MENLNFRTFKQNYFIIANNVKYFEPSQCVSYYSSIMAWLGQETRQSCIAFSCSSFQQQCILLENIQTSAKQSLGLHELKQNKPWFDEECLGFFG